MNDRTPRENLKPATASAARLIVPGMRSDHCAGLISTSLKRLEGVANIRTNVVSHRVDVEFNPRQIDIDSLKAAVEILESFIPTRSTRHESQ